MKLFSKAPALMEVEAGEASKSPLNFWEGEGNRGHCAAVQRSTIDKYQVVVVPCMLNGFECTVVIEIVWKQSGLFQGASAAATTTQPEEALYIPVRWTVPQEKCKDWLQSCEAKVIQEITVFPLWLRFQLFSSLVAPHGFLSWSSIASLCLQIPYLPFCFWIAPDYSSNWHKLRAFACFCLKSHNILRKTRGSTRKASSPRMTSSEVLLCFYCGQEGNYTISDHHVIFHALCHYMSLYVTICHYMSLS